jgi:hypothetical protein
MSLLDDGIDRCLHVAESNTRDAAPKPSLSRRNNLYPLLANPKVLVNTFVQ